jgi:hypothetical protein
VDPGFLRERHLAHSTSPDSPKNADNESANLRLVKDLKPDFLAKSFYKSQWHSEKKQTFNEKCNNILRKYACKDVLHAHVAGNY